MTIFSLSGNLCSNQHSSWLEKVVIDDLAGVVRAEIASGEEHRRLFQGMPIGVGGRMPFTGRCTVVGDAEISSANVIHFKHIERLSLQDDSIEYIRSSEIPFDGHSAALRPGDLIGRNELHGYPIAVAGVCVINRDDAWVTESRIANSNARSLVRLVGIHDMLFVYGHIPGDGQEFLPSKYVDAWIRGRVARSDQVVEMRPIEFVVRLNNGTFIRFQWM